MISRPHADRASSRVGFVCLALALVACDDASEASARDDASEASAPDGSADTSPAPSGDDASPFDAGRPGDPDGGEPPVPDVGDVSGGDAAFAPDAAPPIDAAPCSVAAAFAEEEVDLFWWPDLDPPSVSVGLEVQGEACASIEVTADAPWLEVTRGADNVRLTLRDEGRRAGRIEATVTVRAGDSERARLPVALSSFSRRADARPKVLVIGVDGVRSDAFARAATPHLDRLARRGAFTLEATTQLTGDTVSGPGWTSILTGVEVARHGVDGNGDLAERDPQFPTFLQRAKALGFGTAAACQWAPILFGIVEAGAVDWQAVGDQAQVSAAMAEQLRAADHDLHFVHLDDPDHAGHSSGFSPDNPAYIEAIEGADAEVGRMLDAVLARPELDAEDWLFIFTTDHGGSGTGHGPRDRVHRRIPLLVAGLATDPARLGAGASHLDVHATALAHLGHPPRPEWGLDGSAVGLAAEADCFDRLDEDADGLTDCADPDCACACTHECDADPPESSCPHEDLGEAVGRGVASGDTVGGERALLGACGGVGAEVSFAWTAPADDTYAFSTVGSDFDTVLYLLDGCEGASLACNDDLFGNPRQDVPIRAVSRVERIFAAGEQAVVVVDGKTFDAAGAYSLDVHGLGAECVDRDLASAVGAAVARGDNADAPTRYAADCATSARDLTLRWVPPEAGRWRFDTAGSANDTVLWILPEGCIGPSIACNDDAAGLGLQSRIEAELEAGTPVVIAVAGFRGRAGEWVLNIERVE